MRFVESFLGTEISWIPSLGVFLQCFESLFFFLPFFPLFTLLLGFGKRLFSWLPLHSTRLHRASCICQLQVLN